MKTKVFTILVLLAIMSQTSYVVIRLAHDSGIGNVPWQLWGMLFGLIYVFDGVIVILNRHAEFVRTFVDQREVDEVIERLREQVRDTYKVEDALQARGIFSDKHVIAVKNGLRKRVARATWLARENKFQASGRIPIGPGVTDDLT